MSESHSTDGGGISPSGWERLVRACDAFEAAWRAGQRPRIEDDMDAVIEPERPVLLRELLALELELRRAGGERPGPEEYRDRFPGHAAAIDAAFTEGRSSTDRTAGIPQMTVAEGPGTRIGPYKLLQKIGEGGMGVVYMAEQEHPIRRKVALKVIKLGMDTEQVVARFEAERQALALMDHQNIARVLDAGTTDSGRPYFVMELVKGIPITEYCDRNQLTPRERLELFVRVCRAIQHAHQKGIIHRDIKPSNVLVTLHDGTPVPKVIDFGVAKAIDQHLTERTMFTQFGAVLGTLEYMSPEQAEMSALEVDTRSDVYSLGVLLYELLTGSTPLERARLKQAAYVEVLRLIREEEPPRPSTRLSGSGDQLATISAQRRTDPAKLSRLVRGELDWIAMRALEKDRTRRYETASSLAQDVERYLADEPVEAGPPSAAYRLRKLARKHRAWLATAGSFAALLAAAAVVSTVLAVRAIRAERLADEERRQAEAVSKFLVEAFRSPDPEQDGRQVKVVEILDRAEAQLEGEFAGGPRIRAELLKALGQTYMGLGLYERAGVLFKKAHSAFRAALGPVHADTLASLHDLGDSYRLAHRATDAIPLLEEAVRWRKEALGPDHADTLVSMHALASVYVSSGRMAEGIRLYEQVLNRRTGTLGPDHPETLRTLNVLGSVSGRAEAIPEMEKALKVSQHNLGPRHTETIRTMSLLARAYESTGRTADAIPLLEGALQLRKEKLGADHPTTLDTLNKLIEDYICVGREADAIPLLEEAWRFVKARLGADHTETLGSLNRLAQAYVFADRPADAIPLLEEEYRLLKAKLGPDHPGALVALALLANAFRNAHRSADAIATCKEASRLSKGRWGTDQFPLYVSLMRAAQAHEDAQRCSDAELLWRYALEGAQGIWGSGGLNTTGAMSALGLNLMRQARFPEAEPILRECLAIMEKGPPNQWYVFYARTLLGGCLLGKAAYAEAEPLLLSGYEGLKTREEQINTAARRKVLLMAEAGERIVRLYEAWGKPEKAAGWRARLGIDASFPADPFAGP